MTSHLKDATLDQYQATIRNNDGLLQSKATPTAQRCVMQWIDGDGVVIAQAVYTRDGNNNKISRRYQIAK